MHAFSRSQITEANELNEYRMSNKEFRMMKFNHLRFSPSAFFIRYSTFCGLPASGGAEGDQGSLLNFLANSREVTA